MKEEITQQTEIMQVVKNDMTKSIENSAKTNPHTMQIGRIKSMGNHYEIRFERMSDYRIQGGIYPLIESQDASGKRFIDYTNSDGWQPQASVVDAYVLFNFTLTWRGGWDDRIYFPDDEEYFGDQLKEIYKVWQVALKTMQQWMHVHLNNVNIPSPHLPN